MFAPLSLCYKTHTVPNRMCMQVIFRNRALYEYEYVACDMIYNQREGLQCRNVVE